MLHLDLEDRLEFEINTQRLIDELEPLLAERGKTQAVIRKAFDNIGTKLKDNKFEQKVSIVINEYSIGKSLYITTLRWKYAIFLIREECFEDGSYLPTVISDETLERASFANLKLAYCAIPKLIQEVKDSIEE